MSEKLLVPSIENRLAGFIEVTRRAKAEGELHDRKIIRKTITISREFGCEAYPAAEKLKAILEESGGESWALIDRTLVDEVAKNHDLEAEVLHNLGQRPRWLDDMLSSLSSTWKNERDHFQLLARKIVAIADGGNAIIVGMGGAIVTQSMLNCIHFRIFGSQEFKINSIAVRTKVSPAEAAAMIERRQKAREKFVRDFLDRDINNINYFHLLLNNDRSDARLMAETMAAYVHAHE
ncbi:MAG: cytidylate kinase-like domain protein [Deltaproteobacteria bacterium]|nr:cytidylate kinase-like domain protein [Deltaproteobacteria bacterium]